MKLLNWHKIIEAIFNEFKINIKLKILIIKEKITNYGGKF